jgi:hypothetical protein
VPPKYGQKKPIAYNYCSCGRLAPKRNKKSGGIPYCCTKCSAGNGHTAFCDRRELKNPHRGHSPI